MAWVATLKAAEKQNGKIHVVIRYSDGAADFNEDYFISAPRALNDLVANRVAELTALDTFHSGLTLNSVISQTPTPAVTLTQAEVDRNNWLTNYYKLEKAKRTLVDTQVITTSQPQYAALLQAVQTGFMPAYLNYI